MAGLEFPTPDGVAAAVGYSHVAIAPPGSRIVWIAGQIGVDAEGRAGAGIAEQTRLVFENLTKALTAAGAGWADVVKLGYFVTTLDGIAEVRSVRDEFVDTAHPPASTLVQVAALFRPELLIEVEAVAAVS